MGELSNLPNIGEVVESQLNETGIYTYEELKNCGSKQAWLNIRAIDSSACIHRLLALEGAIRGIRKTNLPDEVKEDLREFYRSIT